MPAARPVTPTVRPAYYLTASFVFVVFARVPEIMDLVLGAAVHSARLLMALSVLAMMFGASIRTVFSKVGICLMAFTLWLCICTPFSVWRGGSARMLKDSWLLALFSYAIIASTVQGLQQCRKLMYTLAAATAFIEIFTMVIGRVQQGRMALLGGTLANANYLAMMLLMGVPFCLFVLRTKPGMSPLRLISLVMLLVIPVTVAATGSRGGLVTLIFMFLLYFMPLPSSQKVVVAVASLILAVIAIAWSSRSALERYKTIFINPGQARLSDSEQSALDSMGLRKELLLDSVQLTLRHPLLGVGPGMFSVANANFVESTTGRANWNAWHETHNTFTQVSCEDGLPGLFLYCLTLFYCFRIVGAAARLARQNPALSMVGHMAFALRLALIAFTGTSLFSSNAYAYYFPMLAGLCAALERACADQAAALIQAASQPAADSRPRTVGMMARPRPSGLPLRP
ncbi:MAG TPA: O-antigen ligase family protein [Bryobacteraceae bacterium]|nr:O-antigen ligase family protein [Bryobacteraceae bacterium]